jgi:uncharacterized protein (DUF1015 family)
MAIIAPFKGLTYNFDRIDDISKLITPPYDVISEKEQEEYYEAHPNNVIRLILGKKKKGDSDWDNRYTRAADFLKRWESEDILIRSNNDNIYLTSHKYDPGDGTGIRVRWGFISLVHIEDEGSGVILPHEKTFSAHKDDRLKLMRACSSQLSQVFGLYDDAGYGILKKLKSVCNGKPIISFHYKDGTSHGMWSINDREVIKEIANAMSTKTIFIADGHHRYETSRNYRDIMRTRHGRGRGEKPYEYLMMYLTDMSDEGLTILPSHRLIKKYNEFKIDDFLKKANQWFTIDEITLSGLSKDNQRKNIKKALEEKGLSNSAFVFHFHKGEKYRLLSLREGAMDEAEKDLHPSLRKLDVIVLSRLILQKCLGFTKEDLDNEGLFHYNSNMADTISLVDSGSYEMTFMLNPTKMEQVKEIADNSLIMPRKSTYFFPKVLTGMVFNKIDPNESIQIP